MQTNHGTLIERWAAGKMSRPQFVETESQLMKKKQELAEKLAQLVSTIWMNWCLSSSPFFP